jgi:hypothetical protein
MPNGGNSRSSMRRSKTSSLAKGTRQAEIKTRPNDTQPGISDRMLMSVRPPVRGFTGCDGVSNRSRDS